MREEKLGDEHKKHHWMKDTRNFILVGGVVVAAVGLFFYYRNEERGVEALGDLAQLAQRARAASNATAGASHIHPSLSDTVLATRAFEPWAPAPVVQVYAEALPNIISGPAGVFPHLSKEDADAAVKELKQFGNDVKTVADRIGKELEKADPSTINWQKVSTDLRKQIGEDRSQIVDVSHMSHGQLLTPVPCRPCPVQGRRGQSTQGARGD